MSESVMTEKAPARPRTSMASASAMLMAGFVLSRLLGLARLSIQADVLGGSGHDATAFATAIAVPDFVFTIVSGGALASSFIPVFAGLLELDSEEHAWRVAAGVLNGVLLVMLAAVGVAELAAPLLVAHIAQPADQALTLALTRIMLLQPLFLAVTGILSGLYNSYHRFLVPAIAPLVYNLVNIVGLLLVNPIHHAVALAAWGVTAGALLQMLVMLPGLAAFRRFVRPGAGLREVGTREVGRLMLPRIVGQAGIQASTLVTITLANLSFPVDRPSAAIRLAINVMFLPIGVLGNAIATAAFPTLAGQAARGDLRALAATVARTLRMMLFLALPAGVALMVLRYPITTVLFRRGVFSAHDTDLVAAGLLLGGAGVPQLVVVELLPRIFFALKDTWTPVLINLVTLTMAIVLSIVGAALAHGDSIVGVALLVGAISVTVLVEVAWLGIVLRRRIPALGARDLGLSLLRALVASEAMGVALLALLFLWRQYGPGGGPGDLLLLCVAVPLGVAVYAGWAYVVNAPELIMVGAWVRARMRAPGRRAGKVSS